MTHPNGTHSRSFHLHVAQWSDTPERLRWSATRTVWAMGRTAQSGLLAEGEMELDYDPGALREVAGTLLGAALGAYIDALGPSSVRTVAQGRVFCPCGKPADHTGADPDSPEWACRVGYAHGQVGPSPAGGGR